MHTNMHMYIYIFIYTYISDIDMVFDNQHHYISGLSVMVLNKLKQNLINFIVHNIEKGPS